MARLKLSWLGPPEIGWDGRPLRLEMRKTLALLAYLSLSPQAPTRETLAALFWPEFDQQHALSNLRRNLSSLTRSLPVRLLEIDRERVGLLKDDAVLLDVDEFRSLLKQMSKYSGPTPDCSECFSLLEQAVGLYRGDFFEGFNLKDCPEFDDWQFFQREELRADYAGALEKLAGMYREKCVWEKAIPHARAWLALDRLNEPAHRLLMHLYFHSGQRSAALRQFEDCVRILEQELGQPPEAETLSAYEEIRSGIPALPIREPIKVSTKKTGPTLVDQELPLIKTKLFLPKLPRTFIPRPRLIDHLNRCTQLPLTLISASAGFGKSTVLTDWVTQTEIPAAWISLDSGDNDPHRLMSYIVTALRQALPKFNLGSSCLDLLHDPEATQPDAILSSLVNDLIAARTEVVLILDDYHVIHAQPAHQVILFLLDHLPPSLHLLLSSRTDPPLPLARMRANYQVDEIRTNDLRFTPDEAQSFISKMMGFSLSGQDLSFLDEKIEGWIAGIQMAAIAIQSNPRYETAEEIQGFIRGFRGSHRYILDYLLEEVLNRQPVEIRDFLLETSILEKMCGPLCDRLLAESYSIRGPDTGDDASNSDTRGQYILEQLERNNLFVIPLDEERIWYRYHHLFADLLHARLQQHKPELEAALHHRAACWYEESSSPREAVHHALAAGDSDLAGELIEKHSLRMINLSEIATVDDWLQSLPKESIQARPRLILYREWVQSRMGKLDTIGRVIDEVEGRIASQPQTPETEELMNLITMFRAYQANMQGDVETAIQITLRGTKISPSLITSENYKTFFQLGYAYYTKGDLDTAELIFREVARAADAVRDIYNTTISKGELAGIEIVRGQLKAAENIYHQVIEKIQECVSNPEILECIFKISLAGIAYERNDLNLAERLINEGIEFAVIGKRTNSFAFGLTIRSYLSLAKARQSQAYLEAARRDTEEAVLYIQSHKMYPRTCSQVSVCRVNVWLAGGNLEQAQQWMGQYYPPADGNLPFHKELEFTAVGQILLASKKYQEALDLLEQLSRQAEAGGRFGRWLKINILRASALWGLGRESEALGALEDCLDYARTDGYKRVFVEEGPSMINMILRGLQLKSWSNPDISHYAEIIAAVN